MSSPEGKQWLRSRIEGLTASQPVSVLDVGPGVGTYAKLLRRLPISKIIGLEIWEPYLSTYRLAEFYDELIVGDVRTADLPQVDVVILGDVLEHMDRTEAQAVWDKCSAAASRAVYLSIPIVHYPQGEIEGNPHETHVEADWSHDAVLTDFAGIGAFDIGAVVGAYERLTGN